MVSWCLLTLTALLCCVKDLNAATYAVLVDDHDRGTNGVYKAEGSALVACKISGITYDAEMQKIVTYRGTPQSVNYVRVFKNPFTYLNLTLSGPDRQHDVITYRCTDGSGSNCPDYAQVTVSFSHTPSAAAVIAGCRPGGSDSPSVNPTSSSSSPSNRPATQPSSNGGTGTGGAGQKFQGLNPLIYTISAVILLGTLAIVAIITCWIRARRSYNRRMFQSSANPQDYLDYISDNEFTPLTTSEFVASLQERPPTYNESEEIEGQTRPEGEGDTESAGAASGGGDGGGAEGEEARPTTATTATNTSTAAGGGTSTSSNARSRPPRPPPPLTIPNSNRSQPPPTSTAVATSSSSSGTTAATTSSNEDAPDVTNEDCPPISCGTDLSLSESSQVVSRQDVNEGGAPDIITCVATGGADEPTVPVLSGIDALLSIDLSTGNGNGTQPLPTLPTSSSSLTESAAVGTLIDFGSSSSDSSTPAVSSSQSTFHSIPPPTPEQISEMEAAIGALNEHMTRIRERTE